MMTSEQKVTYEKKIGDIYDSLFDDEPSANMVPIINFFNEFHAKQTRRKTRASKKVMAQGGKFIGTKAPFGYIIDPDDKHHLLPDEEAAPTVRLIFQYACNGLGFKAIALHHLRRALPSCSFRCKPQGECRRRYGQASNTPTQA